MTVIKFGKQYGSNVSYLKDDSKEVPLTISHYISSISITTSLGVDSMKFNYSSSNLLNKNSESGIHLGLERINTDNHRRLIFNVTEKDPNERINRIRMYIDVQTNLSNESDHYIAGIQFHTTFNRPSPFYGRRTGQISVEDYPGFVLGYVRGEAYKQIGSLQFIWYKVQNFK